MRVFYPVACGKWIKAKRHRLHAPTSPTFFPSHYFPGIWQHPKETSLVFRVETMGETTRRVLVNQWPVRLIVKSKVLGSTPNFNFTRLDCVITLIKRWCCVSLSLLHSVMKCYQLSPCEHLRAKMLEFDVTWLP